MLNPVSIHCIYFKYEVQLYIPVSQVAPVYPVPVQSQVKLPGGVLSQVPPFEHGVPVAHSSISAIKKKLAMTNWCNQNLTPTLENIVRVTKITNNHNTKRTYGKPNVQLFPKTWTISYKNITKYHLDTY